MYGKVGKVFLLPGVFMLMSLYMNMSEKRREF